jgi:hypothetical protein
MLAWRTRGAWMGVIVERHRAMHLDGMCIEICPGRDILVLEEY